jgi:hypothetical protein
MNLLHRSFVIVGVDAAGLYACFNVSLRIMFLASAKNDCAAGQRVKPLMEKLRKYR